jgi:putative endonuclease
MRQVKYSTVKPHHNFKNDTYIANLTAVVYILTNKTHSVLYTGVTSDLKQRMERHQMKYFKKSFTAKYNVCKLVYFERHDSMLKAIAREKQIKAGSRAKKIALIESMNPGWVALVVASLRSQ